MEAFVRRRGRPRKGEPDGNISDAEVRRVRAEIWLEIFQELAGREQPRDMGVPELLRLLAERIEHGQGRGE